MSQVVISSTPSLRLNFWWTMLGNVVYAGCQWAMLVVFAKLGSPQMVGQFALGLAVTAPVILLASLALRPVQSTDARREYPFGHYLGLRLITMALAFVMLVGITLTAGYRRETALVILAVALAKIFEAVSDVFYGLLQQHERMDRIALSMVMKGILSVGALGIGAYLTGGVLGGTIGLAASWALILATYDIRSGFIILSPSRLGRACALMPVFEMEALRKLAWLTLPLGLAMMLNSLSSSIPRYFVERFFGEGELGIFAAVAYLAGAAGIAVNALGQSASPRLAKRYAESNCTAFLSLLLKLLGFGVALGAAGLLLVIAIGRELLTLLYRPEYGEHVDILVWMMVAAAIGHVASFLGYGMAAARLFRIQPLLYASSAVVAAAGCLIFIPRHGLKGAAWAYCFSLGVQLIGALACNVYSLGRLVSERPTIR